MLYADSGGCVVAGTLPHRHPRVRSTSLTLQLLLAALHTSIKPQHKHKPTSRVPA